MTYLLESPFLQFAIDPRQSAWSLNSHDVDGPSLEGAWMRVNYRMGLSSLLRTRKTRFQFLEKWFKPRISEERNIPSRHGTQNRLTLQMGPDVNGICYRLEFCTLLQHPLFLWKLSLINGGKHAIEVGDIEMLRVGFFPKRSLLPMPGPLSHLYHNKPVGYGAVRPSQNPGELGFFSNGWQSWSFCGAYGSSDAQRVSRLGPFAAQVWYSRGKAPSRKKGVFTSDMFGVIGDRAHRTGILVGYLSQLQQFGTVDAYIGDPLYPALSLIADGDRARLDPGLEFSTDWAVIQFVDLDVPDPLGPYLDAVARENQVAPSIHQRDSFVGWCSWYPYFRDVDEGKIRQNLESARKLEKSLPLSLFQIDDGYETQIGDWFEFSPGFTAGIKPLASEIRDAGLTPGLWLAPFILHADSKTARDCKEWLLRNRFGLPVNAGFMWKSPAKALDLTHPEALEHVQNVVRTATQKWGFPYLKLDFLYAAALKGRYRDRTKTRAQVLRQGLEAIREIVGPEIKLLGCGVPLGPAIGIFDAMRIGADVDPSWEPHLFPPKALFKQEPNMPSIRNALQNILSRAGLHKRWWINDPDCLMVRSDSDLTLAEVQSLATAITVTGGSLIFSDDLSKLSPDRLRIAEKLIPLIGERPRVLDWFDTNIPRLLRLDLEKFTRKWHLLAVFNWEDQAQTLSFSLESLELPRGDHFAHEFWRGNVYRVTKPVLTLQDVPAHGVRLVALTPGPSKNDEEEHNPLYLGSDLHISQGLEVVGWDVLNQRTLRVELERPGSTKGVFVLYLPNPPENVDSDAEEINWQWIGEKLYRFQVGFNQRVEINIS